MPLCKMCLKDKSLIRAHVIPYGFFRYIKDSPSETLEQRSTDSPYKERRPKGIYDKTILCTDCEIFFQLYDDYAQKILLPDFKKENYFFDSNKKRVGYQFGDISYKSLKLFFMSVLWRASVASRKEFSKVKLDPVVEKKLKIMIQNGNPGTEEDFSVFLTRFDDYLGKRIWLNPHKVTLSDINCYLFYLGAGYKVIIKTDKKSSRGIEMLNFLQMKPDKPLYVIINDNFLSSKEFPLFVELIKKYRHS